jgi:leader peptidase (prepilin peptidase)/N-methyltransferase
VGTAVLFGLTTWWAGVTWALPAFLYLAAIAIALALIDLDTKRLPNAIVLPAYPVGVALLALASWNPGGASDWPAFVRALIGAAALYAVYFILMFAYPAGMGFGDVKLAGVLGLYLGWVGWGALVVGWFAAFVVGGVFSIALLAAGRATRKSGIPFGPWMLAGAAIGIGFGEPIWSAYLSVLT